LDFRWIKFAHYTGSNFSRTPEGDMIMQEVYVRTISISSTLDYLPPVHKIGHISSSEL